MNFDVSRRIQTKQSKNDVFEALETQFRKISSQTNKSGDILVVKVINPTFGSINRADITTVSIEQKEDGFFINAEVKYKTSVIFNSRMAYSYRIFFLSKKYCKNSNRRSL